MHASSLEVELLVNLQKLWHKTANSDSSQPDYVVVPAVLFSVLLCHLHCHLGSPPSSFFAESLHPCCTYARTTNEDFEQISEGPFSAVSEPIFATKCI